MNSASQGCVALGTSLHPSASTCPSVGLTDRLLLTGCGGPGSVPAQGCLGDGCFLLPPFPPSFPVLPPFAFPLIPCPSPDPPPKSAEAPAQRGPISWRELDPAPGQGEGVQCPPIFDAKSALSPHSLSECPFPQALPRGDEPFLQVAWGPEPLLPGEKVCAVSQPRSRGRKVQLT